MCWHGEPRSEVCAGSVVVSEAFSEAVLGLCHAVYACRCECVLSLVACVLGEAECPFPPNPAGLLRPGLVPF